MDNTEMNTTLSAYLNEISKYPLLSLDEEKEKLTKTDISWIERNINDNKEECSKKNSYSNDVTLYKILKNSRELEFNFSENTKEETITILNDNQDISEKSRAIVKSYYDIYERDLLSEKDKKEIYGVLSQIYKKGKRKTKCIS